MKIAPHLKLFDDYKIPTIKWWEWVILFFLSTHTIHHEHAIFKCKFWRGHTYVIDTGTKDKK